MWMTRCNLEDQSAHFVFPTSKTIQQLMLWSDFQSRFVGLASLHSVIASKSFLALSRQMESKTKTNLTRLTSQCLKYDFLIALL